MDNQAIKIYSQGKHRLELNVTPGHFATTNSHVNYYVDLTYLKASDFGAKSVAKAMAEKYDADTSIDTIVCMDGSQVIGAYLAQELSADSFENLNSTKEVFILSPKFNCNGQTVFTDTIQSMIKNRNILLLTATTTTGTSIRRTLECIDYHGGKIQGISAIFSAVESINGVPIHTIFSLKDIPDYKTYFYHECPYCRQNKPLDGIINCYDHF